MSPTGSGKTLAAFLGVLSELHALHARGRLEERVYAVYVSPLRALVHDMARNLEAPLAGIARRLGLDEPPVRVGLRTGDTPRAERERQARRPPHVLVTTPESLALVLSSPRLRPHLRGLRWMLVDEVHALAETKRGTQLALAMERLAEHAGEFQRVGLSATVAPLDRVAAFLGGDRPVRVEEAPPEGEPEVEVALAEGEEMLALVGDLVAAHRTTLVFSNTRRAAERVAAALRERRVELAGDDLEEHSVDPAFGAPDAGALVAPHHGSMSREARLVVEERLKRAEMRCVVTSSSLELGVHVGTVDHVVLLGSPKASARALQRVGRAGHAPGLPRRATLVVEDADELPGAYALADLVRRRVVEEVRVPEAPLDVLAQHVLALALDGERRAGDAWRLTCRAMPYRSLSLSDFDAVLDHLEREKLVEREADRFRAPHARQRRAHHAHAGTIPESALLRVHHGERYVGAVEEAFAESLSPGDVFQLAGEAWRFARATPARLLVHPARGEAPTVPAWRSEGASLSPLLARATAEARHRLLPLQRHAKNGEGVTESDWTEFRRLQEAFSGVPAPGEAAWEAFPTDDGRRALVLHALLGRRATEALARALAHRLAETLDAPVRPLAHDHGLALLAPRSWRPTAAGVRRLLDAPLEPTLRRALAQDELLRRRFRHVATRGLLLLRRPDESLAQRQMRASMLLPGLARRDPEHPLLREAWREALHDALDLDAAESFRREVASGARPLRALPARPCASPMAARVLAHGDEEARRAFLRDADERAREWLELHARAQP